MKLAVVLCTIALFLGVVVADITVPGGDSTFEKIVNETQRLPQLFEHEILPSTVRVVTDFAVADSIEQGDTILAFALYEDDTMNWVTPREIANAADPTFENLLLRRKVPGQELDGFPLSAIDGDDITTNGREVFYGGGAELLSMWHWDDRLGFDNDTLLFKSNYPGHRYLNAKAIGRHLFMHTIQDDQWHWVWRIDWENYDISRINVTSASSNIEGSCMWVENNQAAFCEESRIVIYSFDQFDEADDSDKDAEAPAVAISWDFASEGRVYDITFDESGEHVVAVTDKAVFFFRNSAGSLAVETARFSETSLYISPDASSGLAASVNLPFSGEYGSVMRDSIGWFRVMYNGWGYVYNVTEAQADGVDPIDILEEKTLLMTLEFSVVNGTSSLEEKLEQAYVGDRSERQTKMARVPNSNFFVTANYEAEFDRFTVWETNTDFTPDVGGDAPSAAAGVFDNSNQFLATLLAVLVAFKMLL